MGMKSWFMLPIAIALLAGCRQPEVVGASIEDTTEVTATVESVDQTAREVLLRRSEGRLVTVRVGPEVRNLPQMRNGDRVVVVYREALAAQLSPPGATGAPVAAAGQVARAPVGQRPGGELEEAIRVRVRIESVDPRTNTVSFIGPNRVLRVVRVRDPGMQAFARTLRPGDDVDLIYREAVAISVEPARSSRHFNGNASVHVVELVTQPRTDAPRTP